MRLIDTELAGKGITEYSYAIEVFVKYRLDALLFGENIIEHFEKKLLKYIVAPDSKTAIDFLHTELSDTDKFVFIKSFNIVSFEQQEEI
jgi:hypothetical protein